MPLLDKQYQYICAAPVCAVIAVLCMLAANESYWEMDPYPGDYTIEEVREMCGGIG